MNLHTILQILEEWFYKEDLRHNKWGLKSIYTCLGSKIPHEKRKKKQNKNKQEKEINNEKKKKKKERKENIERLIERDE